MHRILKQRQDVIVISHAEHPVFLQFLQFLPTIQYGLSYLSQSLLLHFFLQEVKQLSHTITKDVVQDRM